jgi:hypothetical protein
MERWRDVPGWEGIYQVSDKGRLKSFKGEPSGRVLSNKNKTGGYFNVVLCGKGRERKSIKLHRLVAEAFVPNPEGKPQVNHKDGNKQNNSADNLEWVTEKENMEHAAKSNPAFLKEMNKWNRIVRPKRVLQRSLSGKILGVFLNCKEASRATGICGRNIHQVASKTEYKPGFIRSQAGGFVWEFLDAD